MQHSGKSGKAPKETTNNININPQQQTVNPPEGIKTNNMRYKQNLRVEGNRVISYTTHVATIQGSKLIIHGRWSMTTSKHVNHVADVYGLKKVYEDKKPPQEDQDTGAGILRMAGAFAALTALTSPQEEANEINKRIFTAAGCTFPEDWDQLTEEEKTRRLDGVRAIALEK